MDSKVEEDCKLSKTFSNVSAEFSLFPIFGSSSDWPDGLRGAFKNNELASICWIWGPETYLTKRNFWPPGKNEAKLVDAYTSENYRNQGLASTLFKFTAKKVKEYGYERLYCRIWHSNKPSLRAFEKAGWIKHAVVYEITPVFCKKPLRFVRKIKSS